MTSQQPIYARARTVTALTGVSVDKLQALAKAGLIRAVRAGNPAQKQTPTLYRLQDVIDWLEGLPAVAAK